VRQRERLRHGHEDGGEATLQRGAQRTGIGYLCCFPAQVLDDAAARLDTHVAHEQLGFQLLQQRLVHVAAEQRRQLQATAQSGEESWGGCVHGGGAGFHGGGSRVAQATDGHKKKGGLAAALGQIKRIPAYCFSVAER